VGTLQGVLKGFVPYPFPMLPYNDLYAEGPKTNLSLGRIGNPSHGSS